MGKGIKIKRLFLEGEITEIIKQLQLLVDEYGTQYKKLYLDDFGIDTDGSDMFLIGEKE
jgi:hypothetical protein